MSSCALNQIQCMLNQILWMLSSIDRRIGCPTNSSTIFGDLESLIAITTGCSINIAPLGLTNQTVCQTIGYLANVLLSRAPCLYQNGGLYNAGTTPVIVAAGNLPAYVNVLGTNGAPAAANITISGFTITPAGVVSGAGTSFTLYPGQSACVLAG